jgi:hypothetical protein
MKSTLCLLGGLCLLASSVSAGAADPISEVADHERTAGDVLLISVPLVALGMTFLFDEPPVSVSSSLLRIDGASGFNADTLIHLNGHPRHDLMLAMGRTLAATYALKYSVNEQRPNGEDSHSFPSGHAAVTFAGAEFIRKEYGWWWGVPAYITAGFVGFSRVNAKEHYTIDVVSGAAIGVLSNHDIGKYLTHFGTLTVGPGFTAPHYLADAPFRDDDLSTLAPAPSMQVEFRF